MARVLLLLPRLPQPMGAPYLGQQYLAAALLADGHRVCCLDLNAPQAPTEDQAVALAQTWRPDLIGLTLFTYNARAGYRLAPRLAPHTRLLVAGGPHPTLLPREPLDFGFQLTVAGEGERAVVALARALEGDGEVRKVPGVQFAGGCGPPGVFLDDLDALPFPGDSLPCYDPSHYAGITTAGGVLTSRGCPARCSFCANYVTGRGHRYRSATNVTAELRALGRRHGLRHFAFWDDAFTARRSRVEALCQALSSDTQLEGITWSCITPANMVRPWDLERMWDAGCRTVNFGIESGDPQVLKAIHKGQRPEHVIAAVQWARSLGMTTVVNFMFGFPEEGVAELERTLALMETLAPYTDFFNQRGVLVPFPGTAVYDRWHRHYDFEGWWLDPARIPPEPRDPAEDPTLELDFFRYTPEVQRIIAACVRFKARHNQATLAALQAPLPEPTP